MAKLPTAVLGRPTTAFSSGRTASFSALFTSALSPRRPHESHPHTHDQVRHATFIPRPRRAYTFTQLVQLSDGSTYTVRTTSPTPLYRSNKDSRNHLVWNPNEKSLRNVEIDEAGKLAAFRSRFGRSWDMEGPADVEDGKDDEQVDMLADLLSGYAKKDTADGRTSKDQVKIVRKK